MLPLLAVSLSASALAAGPAARATSRGWPTIVKVGTSGTGEWTSVGNHRFNVTVVASRPLALDVEVIHCHHPVYLISDYVYKIYRVASE
jgi:hypothetical protein